MTCSRGHPFDTFLIPHMAGFADKASLDRPDCSRRNSLTQSMAEYFLGKHWRLCAEKQLILMSYRSILRVFPMQ